MPPRDHHDKKARRPPGDHAGDRQRAFEIALACHRNGDLERAKALYGAVLREKPDHVGALHLSGLICLEQKRPDLAEAYLAEGVRIAPDFPPLYLSRGLALFELGRFAEAIADYDRMVAMDPQNMQAYANQGDALQALGQFEEALARYAQAISIAPDCAETYSNRGLALHEIKRFEEALESYDQAIAINPALSAACFNRGNACRELGRFEEALGDYGQARRLDAENAEACSNAGDVLQSLSGFVEALPLYERAITLRPDHAQAWSNRGVCLKALGLFDGALASLDAAINLSPDFAEAFWNKALTLLLLKRFDEGWALYEWRKKAREPEGSRLYNRPVWLGREDLANKTLLVHAEQGLGDVIQFSRYLRLLNDVGAQVLFAPHDALRALMGNLDATFQIVNEESPTLAFDYHIPLMSLPLAFKINLSNMSLRAPYLHADANRVNWWRRKLGADGFRIGICWQGNAGAADLGRSFSARYFFDLSQIPGLRLISLQKGPGETQLLDLPKAMTVETLGADFDAGPDAFVDTAAVMMCCDLVITSDTAVAHLAGALGVKTWVALKHVPDWRWFREREDSPWYPTMRLFRQTSQGDWEGVFARIKAALVETLGGQGRGRPEP